ncbi:mitochondrial carrier domain-containing protein [Mycena belliarum]|uniref:Mitochondrial carrier domain-containing protein n=1 Tax=Mycena belliarum TaxID=1033014 RepID=A0AAD6XKA5_9AGAR|nr:mitochondrial carrier domain-containing protein [Mycena belliae]
MPGLEYLVLISSLAVSLAVIVPLSGVLVRFRANYTPRGLALDNEGSAVPHTGPVVSSYLQMFKRVCKLEGISGLYKGLMPTFLATLTVSVLILTFMDPSSHRHGAYRAPVAGVLGTLVYSVGMMMLSLPSAIITWSITTPLRLPYFKPIKSLRVLLTPTEMLRPWILYMTPGLLLAECLHVAYVTLILGPLHRLLVPMKPDNPTVAYPEISPVKLSIYFLVVLVSTAILTPLEVIATRLAIQRNHASAEYNSVTQEVDGEAEDVGEFAGAEEDVIGLRNESEPYLGLVDCAKTIINEEGFRALYRAWWITLLGGLVSALA